MTEVSAKLVANAKTVLEVCLHAKADETVLIVTRDRYMRDARGLSLAAAELGAHPIIMDLDEYLARGFKEGRILKAFAGAYEAADMAIGVAWCASFGALLGCPEDNDLWLTGQKRTIYLMNGKVPELDMAIWDVPREQIASIRPRTEALIDMLEATERVHITAPAGTDFSFGMGPQANPVPILGIAPLYGEVAITPAQGTESGVFVVDMATQMGVRPRDELDREPLRIVVRDGKVCDYSGDATQVERLQQYLNSGDPPARNIDEVGIVTTQIKVNDLWWRDGCHFTETVHIAPGNKQKRGRYVHGARHMDGQISRPTIALDGEVIMADGKFVHERLA